MIRFITPLLLVSSLSAYSLQFSKPFEIELKPDILSTHIAVTVLKPTEKESLLKLSTFSSFISAYLDVEKRGGNYSIHPEYKYENNRRYKSGYRGNMSYQISAKKPDDLNTFIANLHDKKSDFDVDISISSVSWILSKEQRQGKMDLLRLDAIKWINTYASLLSSELQSSCTVTKVTIDSPRNVYPAPVMMESRSLQSDTVPTPEQDSQKLSIQPQFELECK